MQTRGRPQQEQSFFGLGQIVEDLPAFQRLGQGRSTMRFGPARLVLLRIPSCKLAFRTPAEAVLQGGIQLATQLDVLGTQARHLGENLSQHGLQRWHVLGQRRIGSEGEGVHAC